MKEVRVKRKTLLAAMGAGALAVGILAGAAGAVGMDFGTWRDHELADESEDLFGVGKPLAASSTTTIDAATAAANPKQLVTLARGLRARVVTSGVAAANLDMLALWPNDQQPTWIVACNEQGTTDPGLQRINLATGAAETILTGTQSCDGVRRTAWGTILFSEEAGGGAAGGSTFELLDPLHTTGVAYDRATGAFSGGTGAASFARRDSVGRTSFEGHGLLPNGVMYYGDENRPSNGTGGGAYFKFVPSTPWNGSPVTDLVHSPLAAGKVFGLRLGLRSGGTDYGQGSNTGRGKWLAICDDAGSTPCANVDLRAQAAALKLTGYYRPEDLEVDRKALAAGRVTVCGPNTGNEDFGNWGEVLCIADGDLATALDGTAVPEAQVLVLGNPQLAMPDNLAHQPGRGSWIVHEDGAIELSGHNNDLWDCLPDGADVDQQSDGCVRVATLNDLPTAANPDGGAEWTGGTFDASGRRFFVSVQHNVTGKGVILEITGWR